MRELEELFELSPTRYVRSDIVHHEEDMQISNPCWGSAEQGMCEIAWSLVGRPCAFPTHDDPDQSQYLGERSARVCRCNAFLDVYYVHSTLFDSPFVNCRLAESSTLTWLVDFHFFSTEANKALSLCLFVWFSNHEPLTH